MAKTDIVLQKIISILFLGLIFFLPLIFWIPNSEVFELPKMLFVYAMTTLIAGFWLARMVVRQKIIIRRTPLDIPILLFLLSQIASTIYSIDPHISWFGWYGRFNGGLWSTISYTVLYYAMVNNIGLGVKGQGIKESKNKFAFLLAFSLYPLALVASATIVSLYALLQHFGIDRDFWVQDVVNRVFSTQGQPNWLAGYLTMALPLTWAMAIMKAEGRRLKAEGNTDTNSLNLWPLALSLLLFLALLFTKSRSGLLGFAVADIVFWLTVFVKTRTKDEGRRTKVKQFIFIHLVGIILILTTNNPVRNFLFRVIPRDAPNNASRGNLVTQIATVASLPHNDERIAALEGGITLTKSEHGGTESGDIRRLVWNGAVQLVKQRPVLGFGPETFGLTYWQVRLKEHNLTSEWNFLYNKAHNEWLNLAANTGLFGLGTHLFLIIWFTVWYLRRFFNHSGHFNHSTFFLAAILAALLGIEVVNFFGFSTVTVGTYQYLFMAVAVAVEKDEGRRTKDEGNTGRILKGVSLKTAYCLLFTILLGTFYLLFQISRLYSADLKYNLGRQFYSAGYVSESLEPLSQAVNLVPNEPVFRNELAEILSVTAISAWGTGDEIRAIGIKNNAVENFKIVSEQSKLNLAFIKTQAQMEFLMREIDQKLTNEALILAQKAIYLSPTDPKGYYLLGRMYEELDDKSKAEKFYRRALELKPDYGEAIQILNTEY